MPALPKISSKSLRGSSIPPSSAAVQQADRLPSRLSIGEVCRLTGLRPGTLRNWEERYGLLNPARTPGGTRLYSQQDVERIQEIQALLRRNGNSLLAVAQAIGPARRRRRSPDPQAAKLERLFQLAGRANIALETARSLKQANEELRDAAEFERQLHRVASAMVEERHPNRVLEIAATAAAAIFQCDGAAIATADDDGSSTTRAVTGTQFFSLSSGFLPPGELPGITDALRAGRVVTLNDVADSPLAGQPVVKQLGMRSALLAPIAYGERLLGTMAVFNTRPDRTLDPGASSRTQTLAAKIAIAIANATAFEEALRSQDDTQLLLDVSRHVAQLTDTSQIVAVIAIRARTLLGGDFSAIGSAGAASGAIEWRATSGTGEPWKATHFRLRNDPIFSRLAGGKLLFMSDLAEEMRRHAGRLTQLAAEGAVSALLAPLGLSEDRLGVLVVGYRTPHRLTDRERHVAQVLAQLAPASLQKAELIEQARAGERRATSLYESAQALTSSLELVPMLSELCLQATRSFDAGGSALFMLEDAHELVVKASYGIAPERAEQILSLRIPTTAKNLATFTLLTGETQIVLDATTDSRTDPALIELFQWRSLVMAPIKNRGEVIGLLCLGDPARNHFTPEDRDLATGLASQAAVAISHAQTFAALQRRQRISEMEAQIAATAASSLELDAVLDGICRQTASALAADRASVWLKEDEVMLRRAAEAGVPAPPEANRTARLDFVSRFPLGRGFTFAQLQAAFPAEFRNEGRAALGRLGIVDSISVPFGQGGAVAGLLSVSALDQTRRFGPEDVEMVEAIARQAQLAIANALAYRQQQHAIERLDDISRMKMNFLGTMRHELRTPLNAILGFSDLLEKRVAGELTAKQQRYVSNIRQGGEMLLRLVDDILEYSRAQSSDDLEREQVFLPLLLGDVVSSLGSAPQAREVSLSVEAADDLPRVSGDPVRLARAVRHIIDNAVKFSEAGARVTVRASAEGERVAIAVTDTGPGIAPENRERIFQPFVQEDSSQTRRHQGTGLGLAIASRIIELHGGSITLESTPGQGSTFTIHLPISEVSLP